MGATTARCRRVAGWARDLWLMLGIAALALAALEAPGQLALAIAARNTLDPRWRADAYAGAAWAPELFREHAACERVVYEPFTGWRREPFDGRWIHVDASGLRRTLPEPTAKKPLEVWFFGGSTMWGTGARDEHTIPSAVARRLAAALGPCVHVVNEGESGFVSTQEVVRLARRLQEGAVPDVVVFLDGVNDVFAAFQNRAAGHPHNDFFRKREFNLLKDPAALWKDALRETVARSVFFRLARREADVAPLEPEASQRLAGDIARVYAANVTHVRALAAAYGFDALCYLQPQAFAKPHLTAFEAKDVAERAYLRPLFADAYRECDARLEGTPGWRDVSALFAEEPRPRFIDFCHLAEDGDEAIGERIAPDVLARLAARRTHAHRAD